MIKLARKGGFLLSFLLGALLMGCTTLKPVTPSRDKVLPELREGQTVDVLLTNGTHLEKLRIASLAESQLTAEAIKDDDASKKKEYILAVDSIARITSSYDKDGDRQSIVVLEPGNSVTLTLNDGTTISDLKFSKYNDSTLSGYHRKQPKEIAMADIRAMYRKDFDPVGTLIIVCVIITLPLFMAGTSISLY